MDQGKITNEKQVQRQEEIKMADPSGDRGQQGITV